MTVFEKIQSMDKEEMGKFVRMIYNIGWFDARHGKDDEMFFGLPLMNDDAIVLEEL